MLLNREKMEQVVKVFAIPRSGMNVFDDEELNKISCFWTTLEYYEEDICRFFNVSKNDVLYSMLYWCTKFQQRYTALYGTNCGVDQQQFKVTVRVFESLDGEVDLDLFEKISVGLYEPE